MERDRVAIFQNGRHPSDGSLGKPRAASVPRHFGDVMVYANATTSTQLLFATVCPGKCRAFKASTSRAYYQLGRPFNCFASDPAAPRGWSVSCIVVSK
jgi:hypothetical protein